MHSVRVVDTSLFFYSLVSDLTFPSEVSALPTMSASTSPRLRITCACDELHIYFFEELHFCFTYCKGVCECVWGVVHAIAVTVFSNSVMSS